MLRVLGADVPCGLVPSTFSAFMSFGGIPRVSARAWYGTSAQPAKHFTRSSPRCALHVGNKYVSFQLFLAWGEEHLFFGAGHMGSDANRVGRS